MDGKMNEALTEPRALAEKIICFKGNWTGKNEHDD